MAARPGTQARIHAHFAVGALATAAALMAFAGWIWVNYEWPDPAPLPPVPAEPAKAPGFVPAVLDIDRIFAESPKAKGAKATINASRDAAKAVMDRQLATRQQWLGLVDGANRRLERAEISDGERRDPSNERDRFITQVRVLERNVTDFKTAREKELQSEAKRLRDGIVDEITHVAVAIARRRGVTILFDASGQSTNGLAVILAAPGLPDLTDEVIAALVGQTSDR